MLNASDLTTFVNLFASVSSTLQLVTQITPTEALRVLEGGLSKTEIQRLSGSLEIAYVLGDVSRDTALAANLIAMNVEDVPCALLENSFAWERAITWALNQPAFKSPSPEYAIGHERQQHVGAACARMRNRGYKLSVGAYRPEISERSQEELARRINFLVQVVGGSEVIVRVFGELAAANLKHDGMWLFGDRVPGVRDGGKPALPYGWLISLGLKHVGKRRAAHNLEVAWETLKALATDFAAIIDCQRYSQFDGMFLSRTEVVRAFQDTLAWREMFTLPQVPSMVIQKLASVLCKVITNSEEQKMGVKIVELIREIQTLLDFSSDYQVSTHPSDAVERNSPILWRIARGQIGHVNPNYVNPLDGSDRNQDKFVFFEDGKKLVYTLPRPLLASAACVVIFQLIWSKLAPERAKEIVSTTIETAIEHACKDKADIIVARKKYQVRKQTFELDVAAQSGDQISFFEAKAKSLTARARAGDLIVFLEDYSDSYLAMLEQLARHEVHLQRGLIDFFKACGDKGFARSTKVAVSPISYGPISDKAFASNVIISLANAEMKSLDGRPDVDRSLHKINKNIRKIMSQISIAAPEKDGAIDLFAYFIDVFWLDLGQMLYVLDRSLTIPDAFRPLKYMTFSSRDFWTEVAFADRAQLTSGKWRPAGS